MVDVPTVSITIASFGVLIAAIYYVFQIRHQIKLRQTDIVVRLLSIYMSDEFRDAVARVLNLKFDNYEEYVKNYGFMWTSEEPTPKMVSKVCIFFNGVGTLVRKGLIDLEIIWNLLSISSIWQQMKPTIEGVRKQYNLPDYFIDFEYLYNETKKKEQKFQQSTA